MSAVDQLPEEAIAAFVREQRWFGAKTSEVAGARLVDSAELPGGLTDALYEIRYGSGNHDLYQLILGTDSSGPEIAGGVHEAAADAAFARALVELIGRGAMLDMPEGTLEFCGAGSR